MCHLHYFFQDKSKKPEAKTVTTGSSENTKKEPYWFPDGMTIKAFSNSVRAINSIHRPEILHTVYDVF